MLSSPIFSMFFGYQNAASESYRTMPKGFISVRTQSAQSTIPVLIISHLVRRGLGAVRLRADAQHNKYAESDVMLTLGDTVISIGVGIRRNNFSSVQIRDQAWAADSGDNARLRDLMTNHMFFELRGAMADRKVLLEWRPRRRGPPVTNEWAYVQELAEGTVDDPHHWWEVLEYEVPVQ